MTEPELQVYHPLQVFSIDWLIMFVNQTQVGANLKVSLAVMHHIYTQVKMRLHIMQGFSIIFSGGP